MVQLRDLSEQEMGVVQQFESDNTRPEKLKTVDAPMNTVFDADRGRMLSVPQTLSPDETNFLIKRDVDKVSNFFAMEDVGGFEALGRGVKSFFMTQPQVGAGLLKEVSELDLQDRQENPQKYAAHSKAVAEMEDLPLVGGAFTWAREAGEKFNAKYGTAEQWVEKSDALIERNRKYMADAGLERPQDGGVSGFMYDLGQGGGSLLTSLAIAGLTRNPSTSALYFGAAQKSSIYQEARETKDADEASDISSVAGLVEGGLEYIGLDFLIKAFKGNTAVKRFLTGFAIEATQEASQGVGEEVITQSTGIREKDMRETVEGILYQGLLGGLLGGSANVAIGAFIKDEAQKQGIPEDTANAMAEYYDRYSETATENMTEFIDKELAPIAKDEKSAQEFITLMQKFSNDVSLVEPESLTPEQRKVFDEYVEMFNQSFTEPQGVAAVEKSFYDMAVEAGIDGEQATMNAKLMGARADAASRAFGVTPMEWYRGKNISLTVEEGEFTQADTGGDEIPFFQSAPPVESEAFKAWFGDSKVVDENGKPLVVYHGTGYDLKTIKQVNTKTSLNEGIYFTDSPVTASAYAYRDNDIRTLKDNRPILKRVMSGKVAPNVYPVYLSIKNPYIDNGAPTPSQRTLKKQGYDGIVRNRGGGETHYVAFEPTQIKSIFNRGTFDPNDARILYQDKIRGQVRFGQDGIDITLFQSRNESTLPHELAHIFLRDLREAAQQGRRPMVRKDWNEVKKWLGAKSDTLTVEQEEKFARGFEMYLREGKAPKPELQGVFDRFMQWLKSIYTKASELNVQLSPEARRVFDRMLGADFTRSTDRIETDIAPERRRLDYQRVSQTPAADTVSARAGDVLSDARLIGSNILVPVSTRLENINPKLRDIIRKFEFNSKLSVLEDSKKVKPWLERVRKDMSIEDYRVLDLALKNGDRKEIDALMTKYGMSDEFANVREVIDDIYVEANSAGLSVGFVENYFPRYVNPKNSNEYLAYLRGRKEWSALQEALDEADPSGRFSYEERAEFANTWLRGYNRNKVNATAGSFGKERTIDYVDPDMNRFYEDSVNTLLRYIARMRKNIELAKIFGKTEQDLENSIGEYVIGLVDDGVITANQEREVADVLKAYFNARGTHGAVGWLKDASYIYTMGSPISAITQIGDLAFSLAKNGLWNTGKGFTKSIIGRQRITKTDLGIENILQEFNSESKASNAVRVVFKAVGLDYMDNLGKETYLEGAFQRIKKEAKKNNASFRQMMEMTFGPEAAQVRADILAENMSPNVKYLMFSELADVQPIALSEMPVYYLNGGNWRVMYMLKTYTVKLLDIYRRDIFQTMKTDFVKGFGNLTRLTIALMLMGMTSDAIKDFLLGREIVVDDLVIDNTIKLFGISKYNIWKARREGVANAFMQYTLPPILAPLDDLSRDIVDTFNDKIDLPDWRTWGKTPVFGRFYYWWFGGGSEKK